MSDDELDRILSRNDGIEPSSGFTRNVMDAVRREAAVPAPIAFPWKRALPGLVLCALCVGAILVAAIVRSGSQPVRDTPGPSIWTDIWNGLWTGLANLAGLLRTLNAGGLGWILLALVLTFASIVLSMRLTRRRV